MLFRLCLVVLSVSLFLLPLQLGAESREGEGEEKGWQLMPRVGLSLEYGGFIYQDDAFTSLLRRRLEMDVFQYGRHIIYLEFNEANYLGTPRDRWDFNQLRYRILGGYRYDLGEHYLGVYFSHWCFNIFRTEKYHTAVNRPQASIYFFTLEFLSKGMRLGMKDRGIVFDTRKPFEFLGRFNYAGAVSKVTGQPKAFDLDWVLRAQLRCDLFRYRRLVPYLEVGGEERVGPSWRLSPWLEGGVRLHIGDNLDVTPFFQWGRSQEILLDPQLNPRIRRVAQSFLYGGLRLEYLLDSGPGPERVGEGLQFLPEIHGQSYYICFLRSRFFDWGGDIELDLEALRYGPWTLFLYTDLRLDTEKGGFGPDKVMPRLQYGLTYYWKKYFVEAFLEHSQRLDAIKFSGLSERTHLAGGRLGTLGMKPGHFNEGISFTGPTFQWLNNVQAQASAGHFFQNRDWQYLWNLAAKVRWDLLRWYFIVPYIEGEVNYLSGGGRTPDAGEYAVESGLRLHGALDVAIYYRFQHRENARFFRGPADDQSMVGIKGLF